MTNTQPQPEQTVVEIFSNLNGSGAHACYCERSEDGGCTCALKDEYLAEARADIRKLVAASNKALLLRVRASFPKKKLPAYRQGRKLPPEISGSETTDYTRIQALKSHHQGFNEAVSQALAVIDAEIEEAK